MSGAANASWQTAPEFVEARNDEVHIWRAALDVLPSHVENLRPILSNDERERAARFHFERDRSRFIVGRAFLRILIGRYLQKTLSEIQFTYGPNGKPFVAPRTPLEETLTRIWGEILRLEQVGIHDNFFEIGGHSLLATRLISRVRHALQIELPLRAIFEAPTVAGLAVKITEARAKEIVPGGMADLLADLESISEEEARRLLAGKR